MTEIVVLGEADVQRLLDLDALADELRAAYRSLSAGTASVPPRMAAQSPAGMLGTMPGYVEGVGMGAKLVAYFRDNHRSGRPGHQAVITLVDPEFGTPLALVAANRITAIRTAMSAAVAAAAVARPGASTLAIVGAGVQGAAHLEAFTHLLPPTEVRVCSRDAARAAALAARSDRAQVVGSVEEAVRGADVVCLCTDADTPQIERPWLAPGAHVGSVGSGAEIDPATTAEALVVVQSRTAVTQPFPAGARELAGWDPARLTELGEVLAGTRPGRTSPEQLTAYKSVGNAVEDVAAAAVVLRAALAGGHGTTVTL